MGLQVVKSLNTFQPMQKMIQHAQFCRASSYCTAFWQLADIIEAVHERDQKASFVHAPQSPNTEYRCLHCGKAGGWRLDIVFWQRSTFVIVMVLLWPFRVSSLIFSFYGFEKCRCRVWQVPSPIPISKYLLYEKFFFLNKMLPFQKKIKCNQHQCPLQKDETPFYNSR